jgi:DNA polymerase-3 subunit epsilon
MSRIVALDTETTGLEPAQGHRVIEIGCIELVNRRITGREFHHYLNPERDIDAGAMRVHGITAEQLQGKPRFADVANELLDFLRGAEVIIHNAPFDSGFLAHELRLMRSPVARIEDICTVTDTLAQARRERPGQKNSLDALCKYYQVDNSGRELHGAALDARLLAEVYLAMTRSQAALTLDVTLDSATTGGPALGQVALADLNISVFRASAEELAAHEAMLDLIQKKTGKPPVWRAPQG